MQALFALFDQDKSGELEPEELVIFSKESYGQSRDEKAKDEMAEYATKTIKKIKTWFSDIHTRLFWASIIYLNLNSISIFKH